MLRFRFSPIWHNWNFLKLWFGETVSSIGSQVTLIALPLTAVTLLHASAFQMAILTATDTIPIILFGLFIGVWVDRQKRRPLLIMSNIVRILLLCSVPISYTLHLLTMEQLYILAFCSGLFSMIFGSAYRPFLPSIVPQEHLIDGNSKLELSRSLAQTCGPGIGGILVQTLTAPFAMIADACSFVVSTISLLSIKVQEKEIKRSAEQQLIWQEAYEGLRFISHEPILAAIVICTSMGILFQAMTLAVFLLYVIRDLALSPSLVGVLFTLSGVGGIIGAVVSPWFIKKTGVGGSLILSEIGIGLSAVLVPLTGIGPLGIPFLAIGLLSLSRLVQGLFLTLYDINWTSISQTLVPNEMQGRLGATITFCLFLLQPLGAVLGGLLGTFVGLRLTLLIASVGWSFVFLILFFSPIRTLRTLSSQSAKVPC